MLRAEIEGNVLRDAERQLPAQVGGEHALCVLSNRGRRVDDPLQRLVAEIVHAEQVERDTAAARIGAHDVARGAGYGICSLQQSLRIDEHQFRHAAAASEIERDVPVQLLAEGAELAFQAADHAIQIDRGLAAEAVGEIVEIAIEVEGRVRAEVCDQGVARLLVEERIVDRESQARPEQHAGRGRRIEIAQLLAVAVRIGSLEDRPHVLAEVVVPERIEQSAARRCEQGELRGGAIAVAAKGLRGNVEVCAGNDRPRVVRHELAVAREVHRRARAVVDVVGLVVDSRKHDPGKIIADQRRQQVVVRQAAVGQPGKLDPAGHQRRNAVSVTGIGEIRYERVQTVEPVGIAQAFGFVVLDRQRQIAAILSEVPAHQRAERLALAAAGIGVAVLRGGLQALRNSS